MKRIIGFSLIIFSQLTNIAIAQNNGISNISQSPPRTDWEYPNIALSLFLATISYLIIIALSYIIVWNCYKFIKNKYFNKPPLQK